LFFASGSGGIALTLKHTKSQPAKITFFIFSLLHFYLLGNNVSPVASKYLSSIYEETMPNTKKYPVGISS
jgi:hypothetical protein